MAFFLFKKEKKSDSIRGLGLLLACPRSEYRQDCLSQPEPLSCERARSCYTQLFYKSLISVLANQGACRQPDTGCVGAQLHAQGRKTKAAGGGCPGKMGCSQAPSDVVMGVSLALSEAFLGRGHRASRITGHHRCVCTAINAARLMGSAEWRQVFGTVLSCCQ